MTLNDALSEDETSLQDNSSNTSSHNTNAVPPDDSLMTAHLKKKACCYSLKEYPAKETHPNCTF